MDVALRERDERRRRPALLLQRIAGQQWTSGSDGTLRTLGKCLDVVDRGPANGTRVQLWDCTAGPNQRWTSA